MALLLCSCLSHCLLLLGWPLLPWKKVFDLVKLVCDAYCTKYRYINGLCKFLSSDITHSSSSSLSLIVNIAFFYEGFIVFTVLCLIFSSLSWKTSYLSKPSWHKAKGLSGLITGGINKAAEKKKKKVWLNSHFSQWREAIGNCLKVVLGPIIVTVFQKDLGKGVNRLVTVCWQSFIIQGSQS